VEHSIANKVFLYGGSAGALRAAIFASRCPQRIRGLVLEGLVWTGEGSPTLAQRRSKLDLWLASSRRPIDGSFIATIMSRDGVASADPELAQAFSQQVLDRDESMPTGTYIDMCSRLPIVDPAEIRVPTLIIRGQYDGVASEMDVLGFFNRLGASAKYLDVLEGIAHATLLQKNAPLVYHSLLTFLLRPASLFVADMPVTEQKQSLPVAQLAERFR
jgi:pimeloyl-ACP methyl ester carboxylesterase